jgi:hypothetical protein
MKLTTMRRRLLREAAATLLMARAAENLFPPKMLFEWAGRRPKQINRFAVDEIQWVAWAVETMSSKAWIGASDLARALAAQSMLRRRGVLSRVCLGVAHTNGTLAAHAWLERGDEIIFGRVETPQFVRIAQFGGDAR